MRRLGFLALLAAFLALPALAVEKKAGDFLLGPTVNYTDKLGVGGTFGYTWHKVGVTLLGNVSAVQLKGDHGTTEFKRYCQTWHVPYSAGDRTQAEVGVTVLFTLKKYK